MRDMSHGSANHQSNFGVNHAQGEPSAKKRLLQQRKCSYMHTWNCTDLEILFLLYIMVLDGLLFQLKRMISITQTNYKNKKYNHLLVVQNCTLIFVPRNCTICTNPEGSLLASSNPRAPCQVDMVARPVPKRRLRTCCGNALKWKIRSKFGSQPSLFIVRRMWFVHITI